VAITRSPNTSPLGGAALTADEDHPPALATTQLHARVTINDLRAMHAKFHPREQRQPAE
jgi:hypothetical protein